MIDFHGYEQIVKETERGVSYLDMLKFLYRYGYFTRIADMNFRDIVQGIRAGMPEFRAAIRRFREFYNLPPGDDADPAVERAMMIPRCGMPDFSPAGMTDEPAAIKNYQGKGYWPIESMPDGVMYFIDSSVPSGESHSAIVEAANRWNRVSGINLVQTNNKEAANIVITQKSIDGAGNTLALGWFPMQNSHTQAVEQRLDSGERWTYAFRAEVSCHEFGHNLGWDHKSGASVMHPYATGQWPEPTAYDTGVAQDYYGKPRVVEPEPPKPDDPQPPEPPTPTDNPLKDMRIQWGGQKFVPVPVPEFGGL